MSKIEVDQVDPQSGTTLTLGTSGDTVSIPSGVTLANAGTVTGIPTSALTGTIALNQMATGTDGNIISYDASGNPVAVATGSAGQVLTSAGAGAPPTFAAAGGITEADQWRITSNYSPGGSAAIISSNWERADTAGFGHIGTGMSQSSGIFTFPSTGFYLISTNFWFSELDTAYIVGYIYTTTDNSSYVEAGSFVGSSTQTSRNESGGQDFIFDVTSTSTHKVAFYALREGSDAQIKGSTSHNQSAVTFIRLGDT